MTLFSKLNKKTVKLATPLTGATRKAVLKEWAKKALDEEKYLVFKTDNKENLIISNEEANPAERDFLCFYFADKLRSNYTPKFVPTLFSLYKFPSLLKTVVTDEGAVRPIFTGADLMCPGVCFEHSDRCRTNEVVQVLCKTINTPFAVGVTVVDIDEGTQNECGVAVQIFHVIGDGLWKMKFGK